MSSSSNSSVQTYPPIASIRCKCGQPIKVLTSSTDENPGRRFGFCELAEIEGGCDFWRWVEPDECSPKAKALIRKGKLARMALEEELRRIKCARQDDQIEVSRVQARHREMVEKVLVVEELEKLNGCLKEKTEHLETELAKSKAAEGKWRNTALVCGFLLVCKIVGI